MAVINGSLCKVTRFLEFVYGLVLKKMSETKFVPYAVTVQLLSRIPLLKDILVCTRYRKHAIKL